MRAFRTIWAVNAVQAAAGAAIVGFGVLRLEDTSLRPHIRWWLLLPIFFALERAEVHFQFRSEALTFSLSEGAVVVGLFLADPVALVLVEIAGRSLATIATRAQRGVKLAFNLTHYLFSAGTGVLVFRALAGSDLQPGARTWVAALVAVGVKAAISNLLISGIISVVEQTRYRKVVREFGTGVGIELVTACLALAGVTLIVRQPDAAWLLVVPASVVWISYRAYTAQRREHDRLGELYGASRTLQQATEMEAIVRAALDRARRMFRADVAGIALVSRDGAPGIRSVLRGHDEFAIEDAAAPPPPPPDDEATLLRPVPDGHPVLRIAAAPLRDALVVPLFVGGSPTGTFFVADRAGGIGSFKRDELPSFAALAGNIGSALENAWLLARLRTSIDELRELADLKGSFVTMITHELRTPLTSIHGFVHTLLRSDVRMSEEDRTASLEAIARQTARLHAIVEDMLDLTQLESGAVRPAAAPVSIPMIVGAIEGEVGARAPAGRLSVDVAADVPSVSTDGRMVRKIVYNLVENALKFSPGDVAIVARHEDDGVRISVVDGGPGVPRPVRERIFERFYQADRLSTRAAGGMGLGLYLCRRFADALGARVWLERTGPDGSTFSLWVPVGGPAERV